jgi:hypothetical protein
MAGATGGSVVAPGGSRVFADAGQVVSAQFEEDGTTLLTFADGRFIRMPSAIVYTVFGEPLPVAQPTDIQALGALILDACKLLQYELRAIRLVLQEGLGTGEVAVDPSDIDDLDS